MDTREKLDFARGGGTLRRLHRSAPDRRGGARLFAPETSAAAIRACCPVFPT